MACASELSSKPDWVVCSSEFAFSDLQDDVAMPPLGFEDVVIALLPGFEDHVIDSWLRDRHCWAASWLR